MSAALVTAFASPRVLLRIHAQTREATFDAGDMRWRPMQNTNTDTPIPPDEAAGKNPPDGAIINYRLDHNAVGAVTLEILDAAGQTIRQYSSEDKPIVPDAADAPVPLYWYRRPQPLAKSAGMHRFMWDVHYQSAPGIGGRGGLPIAAVPFDTVPVPTAPWAPPGQYTVKLTVNGKSDTQHSGKH